MSDFFSEFSVVKVVRSVNLKLYFNAKQKGKLDKKNN